VSAWVTAAQVAAAALGTGVAARAVAPVLRPAGPGRARDLDAHDPGPATTLARAEQAVGARLAGDVHMSLRPLLAEIAEARLHARGIDAARDPADARALLGDPLWELVRPDREPPEDRLARAVELSHVAALLDRLEEV
jgi:hypothetical protein